VLNLRKNKKVFIVDKALGEREGYGELSICDNYHTLSTLSKKWITQGKYSNKFTWSKIQ